VRRLISALAVIAAFTGANLGAAEKDTRAGNCDDAKKQMEYFCAENSKDTMVAIGTACNNAKNNVKAACEGVVEPDKKYEFKDK
jgi:hypothetical protein